MPPSPSPPPGTRRNTYPKLTATGSGGRRESAPQRSTAGSPSSSACGARGQTASGRPKTTFQPGRTRWTDEKGIYKAMKEYLDRGYKIEKKFDPRKYNYDVEKQIKKILKNG